MKQEYLNLLNYQENFADNFTTIAYAKILEEKTGYKYYFENSPQKRENFENKMAYFDIEYNYISSATVKKISNRANIYNKDFIDNKRLLKNARKRKNKNSILDLKFFPIEDISNITSTTRKMFNFNNCDFIVNYDVLEKITSLNSVGLYINKKDIIENNIDYNFIYQATARINKYIINPKLFIFSDEKIADKINSCFDFEIIKAYNWLEEFYFLSKCRHKIILSAKNSYSEGFWASALENKDYSITIYDKKLNRTKKPLNWIGI